MEKTIKIYERESYTKLLSGIQVVQIGQFETLQSESVPEISVIEDLSISETLTCSYCKITFEDSVQQRQHYKTDWHRYNLKQNLKTQEPITEEAFDNLADDVSSISGSDSESESSEQENTAYAVNLGKIFFQNAEGKVFSLYRNLLHEKKDIPANEDVMIQLAKQSAKSTCLSIFMLGGGHFAGAVFNGSEVLVHKTFHLYTVRAKQGGAQYNNSAAKSAGSNLRRYNEQALVQRVGDLLQKWAPDIEKSNLIFYRAAGPYNRMVLFGGKNPPLKKNDPRLRNIPFCTRRPTHTELKRVHDTLCSVEIYASLEAVKNQFIVQKLIDENSPTRQSRRESPKNKNINRAKSRETKERPLPGSEEAQEDTSFSENEEHFSLNTQDTEISFADLQQYEDTVPESIKKRKKEGKKKKPKKKDRVKEWSENLKKQICEACTKGDLETLQNVLSSIRKNDAENVEDTENVKKSEENNKETGNETGNQNGDRDEILKTINMAIDEHGNSPLHLAALNNHSDMVLWLMDNNATPCSKNDKQQTPYTINSDKSIRNVFRSFAADNPDKYNYNKAQIPAIVSTMTEEELAEKRKAQRKVKREREKEKRKENEIKRKEEEEKQRFVKLSDREKRALAAERRLLAQSSAVFVRCFLCGEDISGKVPFEYSGNRFCSITCLKAHRLQNPLVLS